jgi:hypothetical protein
MILQNAPLNDPIGSVQEEIKRAVRDFHTAGGSDWELLKRQIKREVKPLEYNLAQMIAHLNAENPEYQLHYRRWSRATGKTTSIGGIIISAAEQMPRGVGHFIAPSYKFLLTRIIPSIVHGLEIHGWIQGVHYFIGEKPPRSWKWNMPYHCPKDFSKFLITHTGFGIHFISQDVPGDGRALNSDIEFGDESALLDYGMMEENTTPTLRGSKASLFQDCPLFTKRFHFSSMPLTQTGGWIFELEEKNMRGEKAALIIDANCKLNLHNLKRGYLEDAKKSAINEVVYEAEYLNIRPPMTGVDSFYPLLSEKIHGYRPQDSYQWAKQEDCRADGDLVLGAPLIIGRDFGAAINFIAVAQHLKSVNELRVLNNFWVTSAAGKMQDDVVQDFHDYYAPYQASNKDIFLCYDKTGNVETGNTRVTRAEQVRVQLTKLGWKVRLITVGKNNVDHHFKFGIWEKMLQNHPDKLVHRNLPIFRINILRARTLLISMYNSKALEGRKNTMHKDKSVEKKMLAKGERQYATDGSDALDTIIEAFFSDAVRFGLVGLPDISVR